MYKERILSVKQRDAVVQSFSLYLGIIVIFLQLNYPIRQFNSHFTKMFLNTVELQLFFCQHKNLQQYD